jgi:hypothetical protein
MEAASYAGDYSGTAYGVRGYGYGTAGTRIGVYGQATGGATNWAGYFEGRGKFTQELLLDDYLYASGYLQTTSNVFVGDTVYTQDIYAPFSFQPVRIGAGQDILVKIDGANGGYASAFKIMNGNGVDCFGADEFGNARTYGNQYIDDNLGVGTTSPTQKLDVDNGNLVVQGTNSFQTSGDAGIVYLGGVHHYIKGEYGYGVKIGTYAVGDALVIKEISGNVGIGTTAPAAGYKLSVDGKIIGEELRIQNATNWPDYVFQEDYRLMPLDELQNAIQLNGHLPNIPPADVVEREGIAVGEMQKKMMEKIEELTLYTIAQEQAIRALRKELSEMQSAFGITTESPATK